MPKGSKPGVTQDHDQVGPGLSHERDIVLRCRHNIPGQKAATQMGCIPDRDLRRKQADHPDAQGVQPPGPVCDLSVQQNERGAKCKVVLRCAALFPDRVGADEGKAGSSN